MRRHTEVQRLAEEERIELRPYDTFGGILSHRVRTTRLDVA